MIGGNKGTIGEENSVLGELFYFDSLLDLDFTVDDETTASYVDI